MRQNSRASYNNNECGAALQLPLRLPYPGNSNRIFNYQKYGPYPEFLFCIPARPLITVFGCDLDIFVRFVSIFSIIVWVMMLILEFLHLYNRGTGESSLTLIIIISILGILGILSGIFCGVVGYIGCTICNPSCLYPFFVHLNFQTIATLYAAIASYFRGYTKYTIIYLFFLAGGLISLFPTWSLYVHAYIHGIPPNLTLPTGLLSDVWRARDKKQREKGREELESLYPSQQKSETQSYTGVIKDNSIRFITPPKSPGNNSIQNNQNLSPKTPSFGVRESLSKDSIQCEKKLMQLYLPASPNSSKINTDIAIKKLLRWSKPKNGNGIFVSKLARNSKKDNLIINKVRVSRTIKR
ncbi:hypothetical protein cand_007920 [Cryptosporidium andersoni]|uniref:Uncharacterized protein n=1 Tax=Cryptosporidium andersoni TaxID=117008 RepID=A0A1J4MPB8_9CRYT|nr:hypothetical protein cand_007920 [Cryptosporidium andersoni]